MSKARITVLPMVGTEEALRDLLARMAWGIGLASFHDCTIYLTDDALAGIEWRVPDLMDPAIAGNFSALRPRLRFVAAPDRQEILERLAVTDFVVFVEDPPQWDILTEAEWTEALGRKKILRSDPVRTRQEFGNWVELNFQLRNDREVEIEHCRARFGQVMEACGRYETGYCLATGPSLAAFKETNFEGALSVVCNSAILDEELMEWVRPQFLVFADPIFHFGPSSYAAEFRRRLRESCVRHDYTIIVPMRYYGLLTDAMPELRARTIGIPSDKPNGFNLDLTTDFRVFTTANILTYLMLPVASTLARKVYMLGCDGRPLNESDYFWQHNKKTQINDQMESIRLVHPGFFAIDYNDYYLDHCRQLEELIHDGEKLGREYGSVTPSFIPALSSRPANLPRMLVIDFTEIGARNATGQLKATLFKKWPAKKVLQIRPLSTRDGSFFRLHSPEPLPEFKNAKLTRDDVLRECRDFAPQMIYFRPTDQPPEFVELGWEIVRQLGVPVVTHIMDDWPERLRKENPSVFTRVDPILRALLDHSAVRLSISDAMSEAYHERYGKDFVALANGIDPAEWTETFPYRGTGEPLVIRYSGGLTEDMSLASVEMVARAVSELSGEMPIRFEIYALPAAVKIAEEKFAGFASVEVRPSVEWSEYPKLLSTAGALLIAYNFDERSRTYTQFSMANKLPECLASGVPLIVFGPEAVATVRRAKELGAAVVITESNADLLKNELRRLAKEPAAFRQGAQAAREHVLTEVTADAARQKFQRLVATLGTGGSREQVLLGPYTRLDRKEVDDCEVVAGFFRQEAAGRVVLAFGDIPTSELAKFMARDWKAVSCPQVEGASGHYSSLMPTYGKDAVAVVLCRAKDWPRLEKLPLQTVATLVFSDGGEADRKALGDKLPTTGGLLSVWSGHYAPLSANAAAEYRALREVQSVDEIPPEQPGALLVVDPELIRVRRGAPAAVIRLRKAYSAALDARSSAQEAGADRNPPFSKRLQTWLQAWLAAIKGLNVRFNVGNFFRERAAELRELFPGAYRGRLNIWRS